MRYGSVKTARFLSRRNRFIAGVALNGRVETVHVKNTGRLREILVEGNTVILEESDNPDRKTRYSLVAAYKGDVLINIDSQAPNSVVYQGIRDGKVNEIRDVVKLSREVVYGNSRFDLYFESAGRKGFVEVKGATLESDGIVMFPDAPTERGCKHVYEMIRAVEEGYEGYIFFLIQLKGAKYFSPHIVRDPEFSKALKLAGGRGVTILAYDSEVYENEIVIGDPVEIRL